MPLKSAFHQAPLILGPFSPLPLTAIKPAGWLKQQLELCAKGLTGHLHTFWPDVDAQCGWLGGPGDDWERAPYLLDGLLPLAYLLDDEKLKAVASERIEWMLASQREDGFFGPSTNTDWWPRTVALKAMMQYYSATTDKRALAFMLRALKYQHEHLPQQPMGVWASARAGDNAHLCLCLYNLTGKKFLLALAKDLLAQGIDWTTHLHTFSLKTGMAKHISWEMLRSGMDREGRDSRGYHTREHHLAHVVNVAMGLKTPGIQAALSGGIKHEEAFDLGFAKLMKHHGVAYGMFTGDELLAGNSPAQGTELCAVVELMYTLEVMLGVLGRPAHGDILEKLAFNALPAAISPDQRCHQYLQQANQVAATIAPRNWYNNEDDSNIFGLEPNFGCCTANLHQGWPKYVSSLWMAARDGGLAAMSYAPCEVRYRLEGKLVRLTVSTAYPFEDTVRIRVGVKGEAGFPIHLRIPQWAQGASVRTGDFLDDCVPGTFYRLQRQWRDGDEIVLTLPMAPRLTRWYHQSAAVECGPLVFALQPQEEWTKVKDHPFAPDWAVRTSANWAYALCQDPQLALVRHPEGVAPFKHGHALTIEADALALPEWGMEQNSAAPPPIAPKAQGPVQRIRLVPYGDTSLRISQFPVAKA